MKGIKVELKDSCITIDDFPHKDIPVLYELMRKEKFILLQNKIVLVDDIKRVSSFCLESYLLNIGFK